MDPTPQPRRNSTPAIVGGLIVLCCLVGGYFYFTTTQSSSAGAVSQSHDPGLGDVMTIGSQPNNDSGWPCPSSEQKVEAMHSAIAAKDDVGFKIAISDGAMLLPGDKVRIIGLDGGRLLYHLRVLTNADKDKDCWISSDLPKLFAGQD